MLKEFSEIKSFFFVEPIIISNKLLLGAKDLQKERNTIKTTTAWTKDKIHKIQKRKTFLKILIPHDDDEDERNRAQNKRKKQSRSTLHTHYKRNGKVIKVNSYLMWF